MARDNDPDIDPYAAAPVELILDWVRWGITRYLLEHEIRARVTVERTAAMGAAGLVDDLVRQFAVQVEGEVLALRLPPVTVSRYVTLTAETVRPATWWDMFRDTYRRRWWGRPLASWRPPRTVAVPVRAGKLITIPIRQQWTFPQPRYRFPDELGPVVFQAWTE